MKIRDNRAVSSTVSFAIALGLITVLVGLLTFTTSGIVSTQQDAVQRNTLQSSSDKLADSVNTVSALGQGSEVNLNLPKRAGNALYTLHIEQTETDGLYEINGKTDSTASTTYVSTTTPIDAPSTVRGGSVQVTYDSETEMLVISND